MTRFRNALADLRFDWLSRAASGDIVLVAIDAPSIEKIGVWPWPRRLHAELLRQLESAGAQRYRLRRRFQRAVGSRLRPGLRRGAAKRRRIGRAAGVQAARRRTANAGSFTSTARCRSSRDARPGRRSSMSRSSRRAGAPLSVRRKARRRIPAVDGRRAGRASTTARQPPFLIDFSIRAGIDPEGLLCRRAARRSGSARAAEGQEGHHRRHRARARRPLQRSQRQVISGPVLQALAAESILQGRVLHWTSDVVTLAGLGLHRAA